ncbi:MAG TPA: sodium-independent anion transporter, partial [Polyangiaceae bacterium]|nr:sodium-independent anion transporter [Polyangiaceae bacterium]
MARLRAQKGKVKLLVLDLEASPLMDLSGADMIDQLAQALERDGIEVKVAGANASVRRLLGTLPSGRFAGIEPASVAQLVGSQG